LGARLIGIIGPPASGKTTLAEHLAAELPATMIREDYAGNPFLAESYVGREEARLPSQLWFLIWRVGQLSVSTWPAEGLLVSDYGFCQDRVYALARLGPHDLRVYDSIARPLEALVHPPDVLVHLDAREETLLARIARRGRGFESAMDRPFLAAMRKAYNEAADRSVCPVLRVDCDAVDFRERSETAELVRELRFMLNGKT
jgi:deoxyguanosine kinase